MTGRIIKYSEPVPFHKAMPGAKSIVIMKRDGYTPAVATTAKPKNPTKPKVRNAKPVAIDYEDGFIPNAKRETTMTYDYDTSRGPYHAMLDRQALARQAQRGKVMRLHSPNVTRIRLTERLLTMRDWTISRRAMMLFMVLGFHQFRWLKPRLHMTHSAKPPIMLNFLGLIMRNCIAWPLITCALIPV